MSFYDTIKSVFNKKQIEQEQEQVPNSINIPSKEDEPEVQIINTNTLGYGSIQSTINFDNTSEDIKKLILNYRDLSTYPEIDIAIQEIVNEAVVLENNENVLSINIETDEISEKIKDIIIEEFKHIISMFEFNKKADEYFRQWYEDGRMYVHNVIDLSKPKDGIQKINILSPFSLNKIKENEKYWYLYKDVKKNIVLKIPPEHISFCPSGLTSADKKMYLSYIHKSIKPFNQLKMLEDAAVIYRITRAPERRVFYVDIGQMNKTKAEAYIAKLMSKFKNKIIYDSATGEVSEKKNTMTMTEDFWLPSSESSSGSRGTKIDTLPGGCLSMDTKISLLDGRELSIVDIESEMKENKELWTYSCHPITGKILPGKISWAGVTQKKAKVMKLTLDNGEEIICTPDHKFPIYNEGFKRADELEENESLIPLYRRKKEIAKNKLSYEQIFDNEDKKWYFTHRQISKFLKDKKVKYNIYDNNYSNKKYEVIHHKDFNKHNNDPNNLTYMSWNDHRKYHSDNFKHWATLGTKAAAEKWTYIKEFDKDEYNRRISIISENSKNFWNNMTESERVILINKRRKKLIEFYENLEGEAKEKHRKKCIANRDIGAKNKLKRMEEDDEYRDWICEQQSLGWTDEKRQIRSELTKKLINERFSDEEYCRQYKQRHQENQKIEYHIEHIKFIIDLIQNKTSQEKTCNDICNDLNDDKLMMQLLFRLNYNKNVPNWHIDLGFSPTMLTNIVSQFGYKKWSDFRKSESNFNHRIIKIEYLNDEIEVGTLTIDSDEEYHNYHTFALSVGVFTKNSQLGEIDDIEYFRKKLIKSLGVPYSRFDSEGGSLMAFGNMNGELSRDEVRFSKFINKLRNKFSLLIYDILKKQIILKNIITIEEWNKYKEYINFIWNSDSYFSEVKNSEIFKNRIELADSLETYIGTYFSKQYVMKNVFKLTDEEIEEEQKNIEEEGSNEEPSEDEY